MLSLKLQTTILASILLTACASGPDKSASGDSDSTAKPGGIGILLYGDSGYLPAYPDEDDYVDIYTTEQYLEVEKADWLEDKRPPEDFKARPWTISPVTGGVITDTGLHLVSAAMKSYCRNTAVCDFGAMLGDNIYPDGLTRGADGFDDQTRMQDMFADPLGNLVDQPPGFVIYSTLGNHDWRTSRDAGFDQITYLEESDSFYMDGPFYTVKPPSANGEVELFIVDTSMMLTTLPVLKDQLADDGSEMPATEMDVMNFRVGPLTQPERDQAAWLEEKLKSSTAKWKIVIAHHPIWSSSGSKYEEGRALRKAILPAMCRYADAYIVGHEHTLEIHTDDCAEALGEPAAEPLVQIISGAAAKQRPVHTPFMEKQELKYPEHKTIWARGLIWGFAHLQLEGDEATVQLVEVSEASQPDGEMVFEYSFPRRSQLKN